MLLSKAGIETTESSTKCVNHLLCKVYATELSVLTPKAFRDSPTSLDQPVKNLKHDIRWGLIEIESNKNSEL